MFSFVMFLAFQRFVRREEYQDSLTFHIARTNQRWSAMFGLMESSKHGLGIEDYYGGWEAASDWVSVFPEEKFRRRVSVDLREGTDVW